MTYEEAHKFLADQPYEPADESKFDCLIKGLQILGKYSHDSIAAEHDILYVADFDDSTTEEELLELNRLGFHLDSDSDGWAIFT